MILLETEEELCKGIDELPTTLEEEVVEVVLVRRILLDDLEASLLVSSQNLGERRLLNCHIRGSRARDGCRA